MVDCKTLDVPALVAESQSLQRATFSSANVHRTFRIAVACTYSFTTYFGGKTPAFTQIVNILNKVNEVYGQQLSIAFQLVSDDSIVFDNENTDPFAGINYSNWNNYINTSTTLQQVLDNKIGNANYDIGHLFHNGNNGSNTGYSLLASTNLLHLDAYMEGVDEYTDELSEVYTSVCDVVENSFVAISLILHIPDLHI